jgi:hypothetical protein
MGALLHVQRAENACLWGRDAGGFEPGSASVYTALPGIYAHEESLAKRRRRTASRRSLPLKKQTRCDLWPQQLHVSVCPGLPTGYRIRGNKENSGEDLTALLVPGAACGNTCSAVHVQVSISGQHMGHSEHTRDQDSN